MDDTIAQATFAEHERLLDAHGASIRQLHERISVLNEALCVVEARLMLTMAALDDHLERLAS